MSKLKKIISVLLVIVLCLGIVGVVTISHPTDVEAGYDYSGNTLYKTLLNGRLKIYTTNSSTLPRELRYNSNTNMTWGWAGPNRTLQNSTTNKNSGRWMSYTEMLIHYYELDGDIAYCFDVTTADDNDVFRFFENLSDAGVPQTIRSHTEIMKLAIAAYMWTRNDFALMKSDNNWTWSDVKYSSYPVNMSMADFRSYARSSEAFMRAMVQYMIWNYMNCTYYDANGNLRFANEDYGVGYVTGDYNYEGGWTTDKDGNSVYHPPVHLMSLVGWHNYVDFLGMIDYAYNLYIEETEFSAWQWQQEWSFRPGETKNISDPNVIKYLDRIYATYGYIGSSSSKITYAKQSANSATLTAAADAPTHDWYNWQQDVNTENMIVSAPNYGNVTGTNSGGQFIVKVGDINRIRIRVKVENPITHVQIVKNVPSGFNATGATFGLYTSQANANSDTNRVTTLTIGSNGKSPVYEYTMSGASATLYAKELNTPTQTGDFDWIKDTSVRSVTLTNANTTSNPGVLNFTNNVRQYGYIQIKKAVPNGYKAKGATFGVYNSKADADANTNRMTILTIGDNGATDVYRIALPNGINQSKTVWVKELTPPTQTGNFKWKIDTTAKSYTITATNNPKTAPYIFNFTNESQEYGYAEVYKAVPTGYRAEGAEYTIYTDASCNTPAPAALFANGTVQKFTIGANGKSNMIQFNVPTGGSLKLYVKETKKPNQIEDGSGFVWKMDSKIYPITLTVANDTTKPVRINSKNDVDEFGYGYITKVSDVVSKQALVDGAQFTVYNADGTIAKDFITNKDVILTVVNGKTETFTLLVGTYTVKETKVPAEFDKADDRQIVIERNKTTPLTITNHYQKAEVYVIKTTDRDDMLSRYPLDGTTIGVYTDADCTKLAVDVLTGKQCILTVNTNMTTNKVTLGLGTYYAKEISTTAWYDLNDEVQTIKLVKDGETYTVEYMNYLKKGLGKVEKGFKDYAEPSN